MSENKVRMPEFGEMGREEVGERARERVRGEKKEGKWEVRRKEGRTGGEEAGSAVLLTD